MRKILIDTHIFLWWIDQPDKIKSNHIEIISDPDNSIYVSIASIFEIGIKERIGKLEVNEDFETLLKINNFDSLQISIKNISAIKEIVVENGDPFDLIIIAQAISENLELISYDSKFKGIKDLRLIH